MSDAPTWLHKRAPTNLRTYPAWSTDPTPATEQRAPRGYSGLVVLMLAIGVVAMLVGWWAK